MRVKHLAVFVSLLFMPHMTSADVVSGTRLSQHSHDGVNGGNPTSPFFSSIVRQDNGNTLNFNPSNGIVGMGTTGDASTFANGTITTVGNSTFASGYTDGNQIPEGLTLSYQIALTFSAQSGGVMAVAGGNSGNGLGITTTGNTYESLSDSDVLTFSGATVSNVLFSGVANEPNVSFSNLSVDDLSLYALRSNNFAEASEGAILADSLGTTLGFGLSSGTGGSGIFINNGFNNSNGFFQLSLLNGDVTLATENGGDFNLKGFGLQSDFSYEFNVVPEPSSLVVLTCLSALGLRRRR